LVIPVSLVSIYDDIVANGYVFRQVFDFYVKFFLIELLVQRVRNGSWKYFAAGDR